MITDELRNQISELGNVYWEGKENWFIRYWVYLQRGLDVFNSFKYYIAAPLALAAIFPFMKDNIFWVGVMAVFGLPLLMVAGRYQMHKIAKTTEYVSTITGSIFQYKPMEMSIEQVQLLKEIRDLLIR